MPLKFSLPERRQRAANPAAFVETSGPSIDIYGEIGPFEGGTSAQSVLGQLRAVRGDIINVRLNSGGGDLYEGVAIYNDLAAHPARVVVTITGIAASAGSMICMAADEIVMTPGSRLMLHNAWTRAEGDAAYFEALAEGLRTVSDTMAQFYAARTGRQIDEIHALMDAETYFDAKEAVAQGFADRIEGSMKTLPLAAGEARAAAPKRQFVKRDLVFSAKMVAMLERLANKKGLGYAAN